MANAERERRREGRLEAVDTGQTRKTLPLASPSARRSSRASSTTPNVHGIRLLPTIAVTRPSICDDASGPRLGFPKEGNLWI